MDANGIGLELIKYLEEKYDCYLIEADYVPVESWYEDNAEMIDYKINDIITSELPIDVTEFLKQKADLLGCDVYDLMDSLGTVVYNVSDLGITEGLGYIKINFIFSEEYDRFLLQGIVL